MPIIVFVAIIIFVAIYKKKYKELQEDVLKELGITNWNVVSYFDEYVTVKSRQALEKYDEIKFFKDNKDKLVRAEQVINKKNNIETSLMNFLKDNRFKKHFQYKRLVKQINKLLNNSRNYRINVRYISTAGNVLGEKEIFLNIYDINKFKENPSLLMGKGEYSKFLKNQQKEELNQKHHNYYERVNDIIDFANANRDNLIIKGSADELDILIIKLFDRTVNSIKKIKTIDSEEWEIISDYISHIDLEIKNLVSRNSRIIEYYESSKFLKIKATCDVLMSSQREFNEYIREKVETISQLFGTRVVRNETINEDENQYIRPYKKTITPFTAEVSSSVFASAENNPLEYIIKNFYTNKKLFPEQIQKLHLLIEELETLKEAKQIIDNHKVELQQYIGDVPNYVMDDDESGFYSRLGFANIDESVLTVEYKFSYTSGGGMARRTFTVPMTEETIIELIRALEGKLTASAFTKEQRALMTKKLREHIKKRDNYTCCLCGNSTESEPNLLLEIDHIIPISKGGYTLEDNLQTLCWKCNRTKSNKILN